MRLINVQLRYDTKYEDLPKAFQNDEFLMKHSIKLEKKRGKQIKSKMLLEAGTLLFDEHEYWAFHEIVIITGVRKVEKDSCGITKELFDRFEEINKKVDDVKHLNTRVNVYQPNNPLFTFNKVVCLKDSHTEALQMKLDQGWSIIAICSQPDQVRPDYILGKYVRINAETDE